jgi:hypothetical protein
MIQFNTPCNVLAPNTTLAHTWWFIKSCFASLLVVLAATASAQISPPASHTFVDAANAECAAIKKTADERHARRVALLKESGESDQIPAVEKLRDERVERLCALVFQTAADRQAAAEISQGAALKEKRAEADRQAAEADRQAAAANRQVAADLKEMGDIFRKLEKDPSSRADLDRLPILYARFAAQATEGAETDALLVFARLMRKLGVKVPGD